MLLKVGRHLRPKPNFKIIISREEGESRYLAGYRNEYISLETVSHNGPLAIIDGKPTEADIILAAAIVARYGQGRDAHQVEVEIRTPAGDTSRELIQPISTADITRNWHV
jgi:hypothetical protein